MLRFYKKMFFKMLKLNWNVYLKFRVACGEFTLSFFSRSDENLTQLDGLQCKKVHNRKISL